MSGARHLWEQALSQLEQLLGGSLLDPILAQESLSVAIGCVEAAEATGTLGPDADMRQRLSRAVRQLSERLQELDSVGAAGSAHLVVQLAAGMRLSDAGLVLLKKAGLGGADLYRLATTALGLAFGSGRNTLQQAMATSDPPESILRNLRTQAMVVRKFVYALTDPWAATTLPAVARTAAKPSSLLPWLLTTGRALEFLCARCVPDQQLGLFQAAGNLVHSLCLVFMCEVFSLESAVAAAQPLQRQELLQISLNALDMLRQRAEAPPFTGGSGSDSDSDSDTDKGSGSSSSSSQASGSNQTTVALLSLDRGVQLMEILAAGQLSDDLFTLDYTNGALRLFKPAAAVLRLVLKAGPELNNNRAHICVTALSVAGFAVHMPDVHEAELVTTALQLAPSLLEAVQLCTNSGALPANGRDLCTALNSCRRVLQAVYQYHTITTSGRARDWCLAVSTWLRLLPLLGKVSMEWGPMSVDGFTIMNLADECYRALAGFLVEVSKYHASLRSQVAAQQESAELMAEPLWQLHSTVCRLLHWAAAQESSSMAGRWQAEVPQDMHNWSTVAEHAAGTLSEALHASSALWRAAVAGGETEQAKPLARRMQAMCSAHAQLLPLLSAKLEQSPEQLAADQVLCGDLRLIVPFTPSSLVAPQLLSAYELSLRREWESVSGDPNRLWGSLDLAIAEAAFWPRFAVLLLSTGLLAHGLELAVIAGLPSAGVHLIENVAGTVNKACHQLAMVASSELEKIASSSSSTPTGCSHDHELAASLTPLQAALCQAEQEGSRPGAQGSLLQLLSFQRTLIPPAAQVAEALQAWWAEPQQQAAERLAAAQVAGARSCAYLCCANLAAEGGPAVRQGKGSKRCGACRVTWYCNTTCSGADWRAGHRRVCKALAAAGVAARQLERQPGQGVEEPRQAP